MAALRAVHRPDGPRACPPHRARRGCGLVGGAAEGHGLAAALPWGGGVDARGLSPWREQSGRVPRVLPQPAPGCRARELAESHRGCCPLALVEDRRVDGHRGVAQRQGGGAAPDPAGGGGRALSNPYVAKALLARDKLLRRADDSVAIVLAAPYEARPQAAAETLRVFTREMLPAIDHAVRVAAQKGSR